MGHSNIKIETLNDIVDTLKLQFYPTVETTLEEIKNFNFMIDKFVELKAEAMNIKQQDNQKRFVKTTINDISFKVMATSQSFFNVVLQNGDVSLSFLKIGKHNNPIIKAEFRAEFLLINGYKLAINIIKDIINSMIENYKIKVSEIHLAKDIQGYEFTTFDFHRIKTLSKTKTVFHNDISSEYYFGNRFTGFSLGKGAELLRIYNKTVEISQKKEKAFIEVLSWQHKDNFNPNQNVWRIEFQLRRERLKELLAGSGMYENLSNVIESISNLWSYCIKRFVHKNLTPQEVNEQITQLRINHDGTFEYIPADTLRKRFQRAENSIVWDSIQTFENKQVPALQRMKDIKKPEVQYVKNAYKAVISTFIKLKRGAFDSQELTTILLEADRETKNKFGMSLIDKKRLDAMDYIIKARSFYNGCGYENDIVLHSYFENYKKDINENISQTFALLDNEPSNIITFEEFNKKLQKCS